MEGLPSGDIQVKYQKLATEYSKLRVHVKVLKKGVLDEQSKSNELRETLKEKEKALRRGELEIDSLTFRNQQLTRRVSVLQDELDLLQQKFSKKYKPKGDEKQPMAASSGSSTLDSGLLQEELQKKIMENAQYASQLSDKVFEVSQLRTSLEDYQRHLSECDSKYKNEIGKLKHKNHELQQAVEEAHKERLGSTPNKLNMPSSSQATSCNGDFLSEAGSLMGSEDALSSVDELNVNEQITVKAHSLEQENQKLRMEHELLQMENESLKLELSKHESASQRRRTDGHDSGDFNSFSAVSVDGEGKMVGLLGSLEVPFLLNQEIQTREDRMTSYFRDKLSELKSEKEQLKSKTDHYLKECEVLRIRYDNLEQEQQQSMNALTDKCHTILRLEEEMRSTSHNYEEQMSVLTEHVAGLNDELTRQHEEIEHLRHQLTNRKK